MREQSSIIMLLNSTLKDKYIRVKIPKLGYTEIIEGKFIVAISKSESTYLKLLFCEKTISVNILPNTKFEICNKISNYSIWLDFNLRDVKL